MKVDLRKFRFWFISKGITMHKYVTMNTDAKSVEDLYKYENYTRKDVNEKYNRIKKDPEEFNLWIERYNFNQLNK